MAIQKVIYFSAGGIELQYPRELKNADFERLFPGVKGKRYDGYSKWIGYPPGVRYVPQNSLPVERIIEFKKNPTLHECNAKCQNATGKVCECSCRGKNHGAGGIL